MCPIHFISLCFLVYIYVCIDLTFKLFHVFSYIYLVFCICVISCAYHVQSHKREGPTPVIAVIMYCCRYINQLPHSILILLLIFMTNMMIQMWEKAINAYSLFTPFHQCCSSFVSSMSQIPSFWEEILSMSGYRLRLQSTLFPGVESTTPPCIGYYPMDSQVLWLLPKISTHTFDEHKTYSKQM